MAVVLVMAHGLSLRQRPQQRCTTVLLSVTIALMYGGQSTSRVWSAIEGAEGRGWVCVRGRVDIDIRASTIPYLLLTLNSLSLLCASASGVGYRPERPSRS
jgi:hypothetical protein